MDVLRLIAANRSPDSYVAGATVLHRTEDTPRTGGAFGALGRPSRPIRVRSN